MRGESNSYFFRYLCTHFILKIKPDEVLMFAVEQQNIGRETETGGAWWYGFSFLRM